MEKGQKTYQDKHDIASAVDIHMSTLKAIYEAKEKLRFRRQWTIRLRKLMRNPKDYDRALMEDFVAYALPSMFYVAESLTQEFLEEKLLIKLHEKRKRPPFYAVSYLVPKRKHKELIHETIEYAKQLGFFDRVTIGGRPQLAIAEKAYEQHNDTPLSLVCILHMAGTIKRR